MKHDLKCLTNYLRLSMLTVRSAIARPDPSKRSPDGMKCHRDHREGDNEVSSGLLTIIKSGEQPFPEYALLLPGYLLRLQS